MAARLIAGNWKMHGRAADLAEVATLVAHRRGHPGGPQVVVCPPATLVMAAAAAARGSGVAIGGQDCHAAAMGPHTGCVSAPMLADAGATHVILGHSERRADQGETDADVALKVVAAQSAGLVAIVCVGETGDQHGAGQTRAVLGAQLARSVPEGADLGRLVLAYEPVWAIGSGVTPRPDDIDALHWHLRATLAARFGDAGAGVAILYGGSVKPGNAAAIFALPQVDGALVGGASLSAADFTRIIEAGR